MNETGNGPDRIDFNRNFPSYRQQNTINSGNETRTYKKEQNKQRLVRKIRSKRVPY